MLDALILEIERIVPSENGVEIGFYEFIKDLITIVSTDAFYGKENPFKDSKVAEGFW